MLNPQHYKECDCITEPLAVVIIRQWSDDNEPFEDIKKSFKFHYSNLEELFKCSMSRIYEYIHLNKSEFDFSKDFYFKVSNYGATNSIISGCLNWDFDLYKKGVK